MIDIVLTTYKVEIIEVFDLANYLLSFREGVKKKPGISGRDISVSEFPVFAAVESVGLALAGGDNRVQAAVAQGVSVDTSSSSS